MNNFLQEVVDRTRADVAARREQVPLDALQAQLGPAPRGRPFSEALVQEGISLIAEMKRASPSKGPIRPDATVADMVVTSDSFRSKVQGVVYGATLVSITPVGEDTYETTLSIDKSIVLELRRQYLAMLNQRVR